MPRFLVTAGNTREKIDSVRDWGNIFTGNTGYSIARALADHGEVCLLTSNRAHLAEIPGLRTPHPIRGESFASHADLRRTLAATMAAGAFSAVFMSAAVADYVPERVYAVMERRPGAVAGEEVWVVRDAQAPKVKSDHERMAVLGTRTEKLVDLFRGEWKFTGLLVKFKLEVGIDAEELVRRGEASRVSSGADYLVANTLDMVGGEKPGAYLLSDRGAEWVPREALAARMARLVRDVLDRV